jgi:hypothetical protein
VALTHFGRFEVSDGENICFSKLIREKYFIKSFKVFQGHCQRFIDLFTKNSSEV